MRFTRRHFLESAATALVATSAPAWAQNRSKARSAAGWPELAAPEAPRVPHSISQLGRTRDDPYAWMKYVPAEGSRDLEGLPPLLARHLTAEMRYAQAMLDPLAGRRAALLEQMLARVSKGAAAPPVTVGGWQYRAFIPPRGVHIVHARKRVADDRDEILVDEAERAAGHAYYRSTDHQPSPDHLYFAWAEDLIGNDRHRICIRDNRTGTIRVIVPGDAYGYGGLVFSPSSQWLFWIKRDARNRPTQLYRTRVAGGESVLVYEERDPAIFMSVRRTSGDGFVALSLTGPDTSEVRLIPAGGETEAPRLVFRRRDRIRYEIDEWDDRPLLVTDADGALDRKILGLSPRFEVIDTIVPHVPGRELLTVMPFRDALVRLERAEGLHRLVIRGKSGREKQIEFPGKAYSLQVVPGQDYRSGQVRIVYQAPNRPREWIDVDLGSGGRTVVAREQVTGFSTENYVVERLFARASDGETIPITLLSKKGAPRDRPQPLLLYGYGAYGISSEPEFAIPATVLVDNNWRYAIAHVRGGSEKGRRWFLDGRKLNKRNSFTDFIACAEHLCEAGYTAPKKLVAYGLSAGGLLVGASMNMAPQLWGGVIAKVPFVDMLNTMSDADHPLVPLFRPDWGDPLADPEAYDYIASISPYENVRAAAYPPLLCTAGLKDDRVAYWEAAKLVAQVRRRSTSGNPAILHLDAKSGHQGSGNLRDEFDELAMFWAFAERCVAPSMILSPGAAG